MAQAPSSKPGRGSRAMGERQVLRLLERLTADAAGPGLADLQTYLDAFPGDEERVAREVSAFRAAREGAASATGRLGPYHLEKLLGQGAQGAVFQARDERLGRRVALKRLTVAAREGEGLPAILAREVEALTRLEHPGIAGVLEAGVLEGVPFVATRLVEGRSLDQVLVDWRSGQAPPLRDRLALGLDLCRAMAAAHAAGVVHRDVKPSNVILSESGTPVLVDFGLAKTVDGNLPGRTRTGDLVGTPRYMSPERLEGRGAGDPSGDVWALGVLLYELCTLEAPFDGPTIETVARRIERDEPVPVRRRLGRETLVARDLDGVLSVALEKDRDRRYADAGALAEDLGRVCRSEPILARPPGRLGRALRWVRRHPALAVIFALLLAIAGGSVVTIWNLERVLERERLANREVLAGRAVADAGRARLLLQGQRPGRFLAARAHLAAVGAALAELEGAGQPVPPGQLPDPRELKRDAWQALVAPDLQELPAAALGGLGVVRAAPDGDALAAFAVSSSTGRLDLSLASVDGRPLAALDLSGLPGVQGLLAVSPGGAAVVLEAEARAWLVDASGPTALGSEVLELGEAMQACFSRSGARVLVAGTARWVAADVATGELMAQGSTLGAAGLDPTGRWVAAETGAGIELVGLDTSRTRTLPPRDGLVALQPLTPDFAQVASSPPDLLALRRIEGGSIELLHLEASGGERSLLVAPAVPGVVPGLAVDAVGELAAVVVGDRLWVLDVARGEVLLRCSLEEDRGVDALVLARDSGGTHELVLGQRSAPPRRFSLVSGIPFYEEAASAPDHPDELLVTTTSLPGPGSDALPTIGLSFRDQPGLELDLGLEGMLLGAGSSPASRSSAPGATPPRAAAWIQVIGHRSIEGRAVVWSQGNREPLLVVEVEPVADGGGLALDPTGQTLAVFEPGGRLRLVDVDRGEELLLLDLPLVAIRSLGFDEEGGLLLEGVDGRTRRLRLRPLEEGLAELGLGS